MPFAITSADTVVVVELVVVVVDEDVVVVVIVVVVELELVVSLMDSLGIVVIFAEDSSLSQISFPLASRQQPSPEKIYGLSQSPVVLVVDSSMSH